MKEPSDKQVAFAARISRLTKNPMPTENTAQAYFIYIRDNIDRYKTLQSAYIYERQIARKQKTKRIYNSVMDDEQDAAWAAAMDFSWM